MVLKIDKNIAKLFLLMFPFFPMRGLTFLGLRSFSYAYEVLMGLVVLLLAFKFLMKGLRTKKRMIPVLLCIVGMSVVTYLSTYRNGGDFIRATHRLLTIWGAFFIVDYGVDKGRDTFVRGMCFTLNLITLLNLLGILLFYSRGSLRAAGDFWLFGQRNAMKLFLLPAVAFNLMLDVQKGIRISFRSFAITLIACASVIVVRSAASSVVLVAMAGILYAYRRWGFTVVTLKALVIVFLSLQVVLVGMRAISIFSPIVVRLLRRDLTLTGRIDIWDSALRGIRAHPILGTGIQLLDDSELTTTSGTLFSQAHNILLDICYKTGFLGLALMIGIYVFSAGAFRKSGTEPVAYINGIMIGLFLITGLVGDIWAFGFFVALFFAAYFDEPKSLPERRKIQLPAPAGN